VATEKFACSTQIGLVHDLPNVQTRDPVVTSWANSAVPVGLNMQILVLTRSKAQIVVGLCERAHFRRLDLSTLRRAVLIRQFALVLLV
jgi:hypothetical protein